MRHPTGTSSLSSSPPAKRQSEWARWLIVLLPAATLLQILVVYLRVRHSYYFSDDFLNFEIYRELHFTRRYLLRDVFGQLAPGYRAVQALVFKAFGLNYGAALAIICLLAAGSAVTLMMIGVRLGASPALVAAVSLPFIFQLQMTHVELWWSASLHSLPGLLAALLGLFFLIGRAGVPDDDGAIAGALCYAIGLLFFSKVMFAGAMYFGVLLFLRQRERPLSELPGNIRATIRQLRYIILVAVCWAIAVGLLTDSLGAPKPPLATILQTIWNSVSDGVAAGALGLGSSGALLFGSYPWTIAIAFAILAALVGATFWAAGASAAILWICYAGYLVSAMGTIALARAGVFGAGIGRSLRYNIETVTFLLVALLVAFAAASSSGSRRSRRGSRIGLAVAILLALNLTIQSRNIADHWDVAGVRTYIETLTRSLNDAAKSSDVVLADEPVASLVVPDWMSPYNRLRGFIRLFPVAPPVVAPDQATHRVDQSGRIVPR
jgi:hypothetical protein